jgi:hypothetical protein
MRKGAVQGRRTTAHPLFPKDPYKGGKDSSPLAQVWYLPLSDTLAFESAGKASRVDEEILDHQWSASADARRSGSKEVVSAVSETRKNYGVGNQTPSGSGTDQTPPANKASQRASEDDDIDGFAVGVVILTSIFITLLTELALAIVGAGLKTTAMAGASTFGGTFGLGYVTIRRLGLTRTET